MSKSLESLVKFYNHLIEEKRKEIAKCHKNKEQLNHYSQKMDEELKAEQDLVAHDPIISMSFENYRRVIKERQDIISSSLIDIDNQLANLENDVVTIFSEMKKYDILLKRRLKILKDEEDSKEIKELDEISMVNYLSNTGDGLDGD